MKSVQLSPIVWRCFITIYKPDIMVFQIKKEEETHTSQLGTKGTLIVWFWKDEEVFRKVLAYISDEEKWVYFYEGWELLNAKCSHISSVQI